MEAISRKKKVKEGHRGFVMKVIAQIEENKDDALKLRQMGNSLKEKIRVIEGLVKEILDLLNELEEDNDDECAEELEESGNFKDKVSYALLKKEDLEKKIMSLSDLPRQLFLRRSESVDSGSNIKIQRIRLPKMKIKKFSGCPQEWQELWDSYKSAEHENEQSSDIDKFNYFKHFLEHAARKVISGLELTEANYEEALKLLEKRFAKPGVIENVHINGIIKAQNVLSEKNFRRLRELFDIVENHHHRLQALKIDKSTYSSILVPVVMDKIRAQFV